MGDRVNVVAECTVPEKILLAASQLEDEGQSPFSAEALIVGAWQKFPKTFGLKGYADQYPDSNKILTSGEDGLVQLQDLEGHRTELIAASETASSVVTRWPSCCHRIQPTRKRRISSERSPAKSQTTVTACTSSSG